MSTKNSIVFDCGEYPAPASLVAAMETMPMRVVPYEFEGETYCNRYPDPDTKAGQCYWAWFRVENARCTKCYMSNKDFEPRDFT